ncbi:MAG: hypothetical protein ACE5E7_06835 [Anaerolineae bacterium]
MNDRPGCLSGLLRLLLLSWLFDWLQDNFGFGKGLSCTGCGCGMVLLVLFLFFACTVLTGTDWFQLGF